MADFSEVLSLMRPSVFVVEPLHPPPPTNCCTRAEIYCESLMVLKYGTLRQTVLMFLYAFFSQPTQRQENCVVKCKVMLESATFRFRFRGISTEIVRDRKPDPTPRRSSGLS
eukprot:1615784-Rhodomonas_salina.1